MASLSFTVGRFVCGQIRRGIEEAKFLGADLEYIEQKGLIDSQFTVSGSEQHIKVLKKSLNEWAIENNLFTE